MVAFNAQRNASDSNSGVSVVNAEQNRLIMVVDDDDGARMLIRRILELAGHTVLTASSGRAAIEHARTMGSNLALVVLDMVMPQMNGYATYQALQAVRPGLPFVLCSGACDHEHVSDLLRRGRCDFVPKPFTQAQLRFAVNRLLVCEGAPGGGV